MFSNDFEKAFDDFQQRREYDQAENALFSMVRIAFVSGWLAAGGSPPPRAKDFYPYAQTGYSQGGNRNRPNNRIRPEK